MGSEWARRLLLAAIIVMIVLVIFCVAKHILFGPDHFTIEQTSPVVSAVDGMAYRVHEGHEGYTQAADLLAQLNVKIVDLMRYLRNKYVGTALGQQYPQRLAAVERMLQRYNPDNLAENSPRDPSGDTAYSLDKGAILAICLRSKKNASLLDMDTLTFVTLHEMTHIALDQLDHPPVFWSTFKWLLTEAELASIYTSPNYAVSPVRYCGIAVDYNPRYDPKTPVIQ